MKNHRVQIPAIGLMVTACLDMAFATFMTIMNILGMSLGNFTYLSDRACQMDMAGVLLSGSFGILLAVYGIAIDAIIIVGAVKMKQLKSYGFAVAASILAIIPCISSPCCALGLPFGIWALIVLFQKDVREAFLEKGNTE